MTIGVAVIGAGMAGKSHAAAYRVAPTLYESTLPDLRYVAIGDINAELGAATAKRYGYERSVTDWREIAADPSIDVVSVVIANSLHLDVVRGLLEAGKHVLCEKPLSDTLDSAREMARLARAASTIARIGLTYRRQPGLAAIRKWIDDGTLGRVLHFSGRYWCDYGCNPQGPMSWRYQGPMGSGALADVGSHLTYLSEFLCGDMRAVRGGAFATAIKERPLPLGAVVGHGLAAVSDTYEPVTNDDYASYTAQFADAVGTLEVSRVAAGYPNALDIEVFCENGAASFHQDTPSQIRLFLNDDEPGKNGYRTVNLGSDHPYLAGGLPMDVSGVGFGQNEGFTFQARAFLEEVAGVDEARSLPRNASFDEGVHNMEILAAVAQSAAADGVEVTL
ncbi:MAG: Gfo/Idh/MocA family oxidoreductase [Tessaracoccus sp.]|uniref:Gfo/Idh/MocA family protein n=1 Tax=Tessaracoccus sp. TaxID=1971211 RepID=UPI001EBA6F3A|nr:Gfo/Idh/MocA family oxidoreductase [Tessaracoccus sp.]MBK7819759.1 Gfo/Idh/MocA family oxidoreductase [Tessaracoccus sp.]